MHDDDSLQKLRDGQHIVVFTIILSIAAIVLTVVLPKTGDTKDLQGFLRMVVPILAAIISIFGVLKISAGLGYGFFTRLLIFISLFIPIVSLIVLLVLNGKATKALRAAGYKVGLFGAQGRSRASTPRARYLQIPK